MVVDVRARWERLSPKDAKGLGYLALTLKEALKT
jgi:hypothetical protein